MTDISWELSSWVVYFPLIRRFVQRYRENPDEYLAEENEEEAAPEIQSPVATQLTKKEKVAKVAKDQVGY